MKQIDKLNAIYEAHKANCDGSFHNCLWQIMINDSLNGDDAAFIRLPTREDICIALGDGGYIPACFNTPSDSVLADLNQSVFGLMPNAVDNVICRSLRS